MARKGLSERVETMKRSTASEPQRPDDTKDGKWATVADETKVRERENRVDETIEQERATNPEQWIPKERAIVEDETSRR